jgi:hypothetical protein
MRVLAAAVASTLIDPARPWRRVARAVGERRQRGAETHVAGPAERDRAVFTGLARDRGDAALGGQVVGGDEAS